MNRGPGFNQRFIVTEIGPPQYVTALNNRGQFVGRQLDAQNGTRGLLHDSGRVVRLGTLGGAFSAARDINDAGVIVGDSLLDEDDVHHGFLWRSGQLIDLNALIEHAPESCEVLHAIAINNRNEIVAIAAVGGKERTVLLQPVPAIRSIRTRNTKP